MKIAVIGAKGLPPLQGGIEHQCAELYPRIALQGHKVDFFARSSYTSQPWFNEHYYRGIRVISLPTLKAKGTDALTSSALGAIAALGQDYDIIHFHALGPALFSSLPKLASSPAKIVVTCHGLDWQRAKWGKIGSRLIKAGEQMAVRYADALVVVSQELRQYFKNEYSRETVYIPNAPVRYADSDASFAFATSLNLEKQQYIVFLGRLVPEKCPDLLIQAFKKLQPPGWKLVLIGGNSDSLSYIVELSQLAAKDPNILFTGQLGGSQLAEVVRGAGLFVLPSNVEGLPLAMLEAMQEGIPIVASDIAPHKELIDEDCGLLFRAGSVDSCAEMISEALDNPGLMTQMTENARKHVQKNYNWDKIASENLKTYESLLKVTSQPVSLTNQLQ